MFIISGLFLFIYCRVFSFVPKEMIGRKTPIRMPIFLIAALSRDQAT